MASERVRLHGSERLPVSGAQAIGSPDPNEWTDVSVVLRRKAELPPAGSEPILSREEFEHRYGARAEDVRRVEAFAEENNLTVESVDPGRRTMQLSGSLADMSEAFGTEVLLYQSSGGVFRGRAGHLWVPPEAAEVVVGVFGLDERPQVRTRLRRMVEGRRARAAGDTSYAPNSVARLYQYPANATGSGQTVAIIELGGGYRSTDLSTYFSRLGLGAPNITAVGVDGARNSPTGNPNGADGEVLLDIEVVGAIAPKARIAVYFGPNTDQGFLDAITTAIHDQVRKPSVISISWGGAESTWSAQALAAYDQAFADAGALGVTVCCASGDDGSADNVGDGAAHVDFPASSPHVLACGGTRLESSGGAISREVAWNEGAGNGATGGGVSEKFPLPAYQGSAKVPVSVNRGHFKGRGVPDVAGDADPATGYQVYVDGRSLVFGGTSAVAPLWAALVALLNQQLGRHLGYLNTALYASATAKALHDITSGNNGAYAAGSGWDACTGLGSPNGAQLLAALKS